MWLRYYNFKNLLISLENAYSRPLWAIIVKFNPLEVVRYR